MNLRDAFEEKRRSVRAPSKTVNCLSADVRSRKGLPIRMPGRAYQFTLILAFANGTIRAESSTRRFPDHAATATFRSRCDEQGLHLLSLSFA